MRTPEMIANGTGWTTTPEEMAALRDAYDAADLIDLPDNFNELPIAERFDLLGITFTAHATGVVTPPSKGEADHGPGNQ